MGLGEKKWMYGGAIILALVSGTIVLVGVPSVWFPMPIPIVVVAWFTHVLFPFVTPALYMLVFGLTAPSKYFSKIVLALVVLLGVLNFMYFKSSWEYGLSYQGPIHTKTVAAENIVGFGVALALSVMGLAKNSRLLASSAHFLLFFLLSWCAFPYLGELP